MIAEVSSEGEVCFIWFIMLFVAVSWTTGASGAAGAAGVRFIQKYNPPMRMTTRMMMTPVIGPTELSLGALGAALAGAEAVGATGFTGAAGAGVTGEDGTGFWFTGF